MIINKDFYAILEKEVKMLICHSIAQKVFYIKKKR